MSTTSFASPAAGAVRQRRHSAEFKAQVLAQCQLAGATVASVARTHGVRASQVYKWRQDAQASAAGGFVALPLAALGPEPTAASSPALSHIEVELQRGEVALKVRWPVGAAPDCAAWLRGVLA